MLEFHCRVPNCSCSAINYGGAMIELFLLLIFIGYCENITVLGTIKQDTSFYYRKLSTYPSRLATVEYSIFYQETFTPNFDIYTTENHKNIEKKCSSVNYGQVANEDLHWRMRLGTYRFSHCENFKNDSKLRKCRGSASIQDFIPRNFGFSFGFYCGHAKSSLKGLKFNISIYDQTNKTKCYPIPKNDFIQCGNYYSHMSLPNLFGAPDWEFLSSRLKVIGTVATMSFLLTEPCYKHLQEVLCYAVLPKCNSSEPQIILPCKEMCHDLWQACEENIMSLLKKAATIQNSVLYDISQSLQKMSAGAMVQCKPLDCDYLPSRHGSTPCFYKNVTCNAPQNSNNAIMEGKTKDSSSDNNSTYPLLSQVEYTCASETLVIDGKSTRSCLYSGQWSEQPKCVPKSQNEVSILVIAILIVVVVPTAVLTLIVLWFKLRKTKNLPLYTRNREYDAFICYDENDADFAHVTIIRELEEKPVPPFKLHVHQRDFKAGYEIMWNILNAIKKSNTAIIVMSQNFVNEKWCREEFKLCYGENLEDPAFKLFVIMMQPVDTLENTSEYMQSFFASKTYLLEKDPQLFNKIREYLISVKRLSHHNELASPEEQEQFL